MLQVPIDEKVKQLANEKAKNKGFRSIQDLVRFFVTNYSQGKFDITIINNDEVSPDYIKYLKTLRKKAHKDIKNGKGQDVNNIEEMINVLNNNDKS